MHTCISMSNLNESNSPSILDRYDLGIPNLLDNKGIMSRTIHSRPASLRHNSGPILLIQGAPALLSRQQPAKDNDFVVDVPMSAAGEASSRPDVSMYAQQACNPARAVAIRNMSLIDTRPQRAIHATRVTGAWTKGSDDKGYTTTKKGDHGSPESDHNEGCLRPLGLTDLLYFRDMDL